MKNKKKTLVYWSPVILLLSLYIIAIIFYTIDMSNKRMVTFCWHNDNSMSSIGAIQLAEKNCEGGVNMEVEPICNEDTGTWWFESNLVKDGCNPECVLSINTGKVEINWRCTGVDKK